MLDRKRRPNSTDDPDESPDIREEASKFFEDVDAWLSAKNSNLAGRTPDEMITAGDEAVVRDLLRRIKYIGVS